MADSKQPVGVLTKLNVVYEPRSRDAVQPLLDIVAVHGFGGHTTQSWTSGKTENREECMWLRELLPDYMISPIRIYSFGYAAHNVIDLLDGENLAKIADALLHSISSAREKRADLPIVFLAHGFGGVIVKKALLLAQTNKLYLSNIAQKCKRLVFFGTPHRASAISSSWEDLLLNALVASPSFTKVYPSSNVATHLKSLAGFVEDVSTKFATIPPRHIINVYQRVGDEADSKFRVVIDMYSATTGFVHETNLGRTSKHEDLCVFSGDTIDLTLSTIVTLLKAEANSQSRKCLSDLLDISPPFIVPDTTLDLYLHGVDVRKFKDITDWINNPSPGIITTTGSNRVGKGLLASAVFRELQKRSFCVAYYSFSFGGFDSHRASAPHLLASIILQLMSANPERYPRISAIHKELDKSQTPWTQAILMVVFQALLDTKTDEDPVYVVIDGLHRCDSSLKAFLDLLSVIFHDDGLPRKLKVALFYQEKAEIKEALDSLSTFTVPGPVLGKDSLVKPLVQDILDHIVKHHPPLSHLRSEIQSSLASCVDLAQLVMTLHCLRNITTTPSSIASAKALVATYPPTTLQEIASSRFQGLGKWGRKAIGWICHARRPLSLSELVTAVAITDDTAHFTASFDSEDLPLDAASELESSLGGLVMFEDGGIVFTTNTIKIHFVDLMTQDTREPAIPADFNIAKILIEYLSLGALVEPVKQAIKEPPYIQPQGPLFELVSYAMEFWFHHYSKNSAGSDQSLSKLLDSKLDAMAPLWGCTPYLLAARLGLLRTLQTLEEDASVPTAAHKKEAIDAASRQGHQDLIDHLLAASAPGSGDVLDLSDTLRQVSAHGYDALAAAFLRYAESTSTLEKVQLDNLLCRAAALGYVSQVKLFLQYGANVNATADGWTPLQLAVENGHLAVVVHLLEEGLADVDAKAGAETDPPILLAVTKGYDRIVEKLCKSSADISSTRNTSGDGHSTALHVAARQGDIKIARLLVSSITPASRIEQHINRKDENDRTPLMVACCEGNEDIANLLLDLGAVVDASLDTENHSILFYAAREGISESFMKKILKVLGSVGTLADIGDVFFRATKRGFTDAVADFLSEEPPIKVGEEDLTKHTDSEGRTALHHASRLGFNAIVSLLLDHGALVNPRDYSGDTPLSLAAVSGNDPTVNLLLDDKWGADPLLPFAGGTILTLISFKNTVCSEGHVKCMISVLKKGVDPNIKDAAGRTALHVAALYGHLKLVEALLRHAMTPVDIEAKGGWQWNALHYAANANEPDACKIAQLLIQQGIDPLSKEVDGWIPLHLAADTDNSTTTDLLQLLWEHDRNSLDIRANDGRTALHFACNRPRSLAWLLRHGADIDAVDNKGTTTLMAAASYSSSIAAEAIRVLLDNGADTLRVDSGGKTALHLAAYAGAMKAGEALLKWATGDVAQLITIKDSDNCPALHIAIFKGEPNFAEMLLESFYGEVAQLAQPAQGDVLQDLSAVRASTGETPVISAIKRGYQSVLVKLLDLGAETNARAQNGNTALLEALNANSDEAAMMTTLRLLLDPERRGGSNHIDVNAGDRVNPTALHQVSWQGRLEVAKLLVEVGKADVNAVGGKYHTALTAAVHGEEIETVNYLMEKGATQKLANDGEPPFLFYPLHAAVQKSNNELIIKLVNAEPESVDLQDSQGRTALHIAMRRGKYDSVVELFTWAARPALFTSDHQGRTVLHHAVLGRDLVLVRDVCLVWDEMFEEEKLDTPDVDGWTPLHWACRIDENEDVVKALLRARGLAAVMEKTKDGWTPESICAFHNSGSTKTFVEKQIKRFLAGEQDFNDDDEKDDKDEQNDQDETDGLEKKEEPDSKAAHSTADLNEPSKLPPEVPPSEDPVPLRGVSVASSSPGEGEVKAESLERTAEEKNKEVDDPNISSGHWKVGEPDFDAICDGCFIFPVMGPRWRCRSCRDFDFCFKCMWTAATTHPGHEFLQISGDPVDPTDVSSRGPQRVEVEEKKAEDKSGGENGDDNPSSGEGREGGSGSEGEGEGSGSDA